MNLFYYRPQRKCGQGNVFTGVCLSTGGVPASVHAGMPYPPDQGDPPSGPGRPPHYQADPPGPGRHRPGPGRHPPRPGRPPWDQADPPGPGRSPWGQADTSPGPGRPPSPREADSSIRSTSGWYASYWNAFLLKKLSQNLIFHNKLCSYINKINQFTHSTNHNKNPYEQKVSWKWAAQIVTVADAGGAEGAMPPQPCENKS